MRAAGHDDEAILGRDVGDLAAEEAQLLARVRYVDVHVGCDFELRLQHLTHGLAAGRPVRRLEQFVGRLDRDFEGAAIGKEVFLLDAERIVGVFAAATGRANHQVLLVIGQTKTEQFQNIRIKRHFPHRR